ncbi:MAG: GNAT family N-acetyltransferase [Anaerolineae bacterium]|nr:GNAT family N-acetyltransferase [Anaerolineae bacterium]
MIRACGPADIESVCAIINEAAQAYRGVIPADRWREPYMTMDELAHELAAGVAFWGYDEAGQLVGVMGLQPVLDVSLIRHAYVLPSRQKQGVGGRLLAHLRGLTSRPLLVGTWAAAWWAIRFYEKHGFRPVGPEETARLLRRYWTIPERQVETSVVLADEGWFGSRS